MRAIFKHNCEDCIYLGPAGNEGEHWDLYFCEEKGLYGRFGNGEDDCDWLGDKEYLRVSKIATVAMARAKKAWLIV